jgi:hypothetical protein
MNVKPKMLARVVSNGEQMRTPDILDRIVEVIRPAVIGESFVSSDGRIRITYTGPSGCWVVRSANPLPWFLELTYGVSLFDERVIGDRYLRPIGGVLLDEEIRDEMMVPA